MNDSKPPAGAEPPPPPPGSVPPPPPPAGSTPPPPAEPPTAPPPEGYPVNIEITFPERELNRTTTFFRILMAIPILLVLSLIDGNWFYGDSEFGATVAAFGGGLLVLPTLLMIVFREKYPKWWFDFNCQLLGFINRVSAYLMLLDDRYPSTDEEQAIHLTIEYPEVTEDLNRFMPLVKWFLAIPHYVALLFFGIGAFFATIYAWFVIMFTGRYPRDIFEFIVGVFRWSNRVYCYAALMTTDRYPPFRFSP